MHFSENRIVYYYAQRASEYERIYRKPERQKDLRRVEELLSSKFQGDSVLEVACGTGYWTQFIAKSAAAVLAVDYNSEVIKIARQKDYGSCRVEFIEGDTYSLDNVREEYTSGFHGFWWSHIPLVKIGQFLSAYHAKLATGARVVMIDNAYVEGSSTPVARKDSKGNTYQIRILRDGSEYEVLKNFPSESDLRGSLTEHATDISIKFLQYFWIAEYKTK